MATRYEIIDRNHPDWRGQRFNGPTARERAERALAKAVPRERFYIACPCGATINDVPAELHECGCML